MLIRHATTGGAPTYVDDVFSSFTYTGNGGTQTITNGIDLSGKGGLVWTKCRNQAYSHGLNDTARGSTNYLVSNSTAAQVAGANTVTSFTSTGYVLGADAWYNGTAGTDTFVSWTFRKATKFFDCGTVNSTGQVRVSHNLGVAPGFIIFKSASSVGDWYCYHVSKGRDYYFSLNNTIAATVTTSCFGTSDPTTTDFGINLAAFGYNSQTVVWYAFAHDSTTDSLIQCGSFTTDGSGNATVTLGWEPQYLLFKKSSTGAENWTVLDTARNWSNSNYDYRLLPNDSAAEPAGAAEYGAPNATGFNVIGLSASATYVYVAIRRPNKPPTLGTQVYNAIARTGTGAAATVTGVGFAPDWTLTQDRARSYQNYCSLYDRLRGAGQNIYTGLTNAEASYANSITAFTMDGFTLGIDNTVGSVNGSGYNYIMHCLKRAVGVFDQVCYVGTGVAGLNVPHSLGVVPEMMIVRGRFGALWHVYHSALGNTGDMYLHLTNPNAASGAPWNSTTPTASVFTVGNSSDTNSGSANHVAYLFATKAGISKVGSFTGDGTTGQTINCGFAAGARFVMIKRTDSTGDWFVWDSTRGIVAGNDPHLSLNTTAAEVTTDDTIDPTNAGFIVNQLAATNVNVTSATYIYLAFA